MCRASLIGIAFEWGISPQVARLRVLRTDCEIADYDLGPVPLRTVGKIPLGVLCVYVCHGRMP